LPSLKYWRAANQALEHIMADDPGRVLLGQDVAVPGGPYGITRNLLKLFGPERVRDTPISEAAIMGAATGAAMAGLKPIVEIMFFDFITLALDQLVNNAAKVRFYHADPKPPMPLIVHTLYGGRAGMGAQHSQALEAWIAHVPGLNVAFPSTPGDVYEVLRTAAQLTDPTVVISAISLLTTSDNVRRDLHAASSFGKANFLRRGKSATVVTYGPAARVAAAALQDLDVDLIDLRWLSPWDMQTVLTSVKETNKVVIVHDAVRQSGFGAEVAASIAEHAIWHLDAPIRRVAGAFSAIPSRASDWEPMLPSARQVHEVVQGVITW